MEILTLNRSICLRSTLYFLGFEILKSNEFLIFFGKFPIFSDLFTYFKNVIVTKSLFSVKISTKATAFIKFCPFRALKTFITIYLKRYRFRKLNAILA